LILLQIGRLRDLVKQSNPQQKKRIAGVCGGLYAALHCMKMFPGSALLQEASCSILACLIPMVGDDSKNAIREYGGIELAVTALSGHQYDAPLVKSAIATLSCFQDLAEHLPSLSIAIIVSGMTPHLSNHQIQLTGARLLERLATHSEHMKESVIEAGGLNVLAGAITRHHKQGETSEIDETCGRVLRFISPWQPPV
jgi:hypothetical protein